MQLTRVQGHVPLIAGDMASGQKIALSAKPAVIFHDIGMDTIDGNDSATQYRANERLGISMLVALTSYHLTPDQHKATPAGYDAHLSKPIDVGQLKEILKNVDC